MSYPPTHRRRVQSPTVRARAGSEIQAAEKRPSQSARRTRGGGVLPLVLFSPARAASGRAHQGGREVGSASPCPVAMPALKGEDPTFSEVARLFDKPIAEAQQQLGLCGARIKQIIRDNGVARWPFRKYQALVTKVRQPRQPPPNQPRQKGRQGGPARACVRACPAAHVAGAAWAPRPLRSAARRAAPSTLEPSTPRFSTLAARSLLAARSHVARTPAPRAASSIPPTPQGVVSSVDEFLYGPGGLLSDDGQAADGKGVLSALGHHQSAKEKQRDLDQAKERARLKRSAEQAAAAAAGANTFAAAGEQGARQRRELSSARAIAAGELRQRQRVGVGGWVWCGVVWCGGGGAMRTTAASACCALASAGEQSRLGSRELGVGVPRR